MHSVASKRVKSIIVKREKLFSWNNPTENIKNYQKQQTL